MSRTDKDLPDWYAEYYEPSHHCIDYPNTRYWQRSQEHCDLPPEPIVKSPNNLCGYPRRITKPESFPSHNWPTTCSWEPVHPPERKKWYNMNPGWWYHQVWLEPERTRVRDQSRKALQDYNANGDTEVDIADYRKKHNGGWFW